MTHGVHYRNERLGGVTGHKDDGFFMIGFVGLFHVQDLKLKCT
jgi:hypothetical protein